MRRSAFPRRPAPRAIARLKRWSRPSGSPTRSSACKWRERLDVARAVVAVLEVKLVLAALLRRGGGEKATRPRIAEDRGAELLVDEDTGVRFRHATSDGGEEAFVDDRLRRRDPIGLLRGERALPSD